MELFGFFLDRGCGRAYSGPCTTKRGYSVKRLLVLSLTVLIVAVGAFASGEKEGAADEGPIVFGTSQPLTGQFSIPGEKHLAGYELAVQLINENGGLLGRQVELISSDNQSDPDVALNQFERFVNVEDADFILGSFSSLITFPTSSVTEQANVIHAIPSGAALRIYERGFDFIFYFQPNAAEYIGRTPVEMVQDLVPSGQQPETAAVVYADDFFTNSIAAGLLGEEVEITGGETIDLSPSPIEEAGMELVLEEQWPQGYSDWVNLANTIQSSNADMLFLLANSPDDGIQLMRALETVGYNPMGIYSSQGTQSEFERELGSSVNGLMVHASWHPQANFTGQFLGGDFTNQDFIDAFQEEYDRMPDEDEAIPFSLVMGLEQAVRATGTTDSQTVRDWLADRTAQNPVRTILGPFHWDDRGLPVNKPFIMTQWQDQELEFVYPKGQFPGVVDFIWPKPEW
jgi:branched-chain amino acid transport system substrate-binding protein